MSLKKDKFSKKDKYFMNIAINLAKNNLGYTGSNPSVGCVVVKNNKIISYGVTNHFGRPHAEVIALSKLRKNINDTTVYLSLEPCTHYGKTPPCTSALIKARVKKVIYSSEDFDLRTHNKSKKILKSKKIKVISGLLVNKSKKIYKNYNYTRKKHFPYITAKIACSKNLKILNYKGQITNNHSKQVTHLIRSNNQAILTTHKTVNSDNPKLNCRIDGLLKFSPFKIILDKDLKIKLNSHILQNGNKTIIFHSSNNKQKIYKLSVLGVKTLLIKNLKNGSLDLKEIFRKLYNLGFTSILIESGPKLLKSMLKEKMINNFYLFQSNKYIYDRNSTPIKNIINILNINFKNKKKINTYLEKDNLLNYYN